MAKRDTSILSWKSNNVPGLTLVKRLIGLGILLFLPAANLSCGNERGEQPKTGPFNSSPTITSVRILPENPTKDSELSLIIQGMDPDGDSMTHKYQWIKNDQEIVGENKGSLKGESFRKGDLIRVRVIPSDGKAEGPPFLSSSIKILNSPPLIQEVWIEPKIAYANDNLKAQVKSIDLDADFVYYTFHWEKNGRPIPDEHGQVLEQGRFKKGDSIALTAAPDDRENHGTPKKSNPLMISNSPPIITSSPPTSVEGMTYQYQVTANDPDQDSITFTLKSGPKEMAMDKNTGLLRWEMRKEDKGTHSIEIEASDHEGAKSIQRFTLIVDFK